MHIFPFPTLKHFCRLANLTRHKQLGDYPKRRVYQIPLVKISPFLYGKHHNQQMQKTPKRERHPGTKNKINKMNANKFLKKAISSSKIGTNPNATPVTKTARPLLGGQVWDLLGSEPQPQAPVTGSSSNQRNTRPKCIETENEIFF